jgi:hypothetical protein
MVPDEPERGLMVLSSSLLEIVVDAFTGLGVRYSQRIFYCTICFILHSSVPANAMIDSWSVPLKKYLQPYWGNTLVKDRDERRTKSRGLAVQQAAHNNPEPPKQSRRGKLGFLALRATDFRRFLPTIE